MLFAVIYRSKTRLSLIYMYKLVWFCLFLLCPCLMKAQDTVNVHTKEVRLTIDNDVFTSLERDQYYTSGLYLDYRWLSKNKINKHKINKHKINKHKINKHKINSFTYRFINEFIHPEGSLGMILRSLIALMQASWDLA